MNAITAVIITKNEERNIQRCLDSLKPVVEEIIVVDSNSTDHTVALCRQAGAKVIVQSWLGYGPQKNLGNNAASHDYILSIDADEALDEQLIKSILEEKSRGFQGIYQVSRFNYYYGKFIRHGADYPDKKIRLFNRTNTRWDEKDVHETLLIDPAQKTTLLKGHLLHYTYYRVEEHILKINYYTNLAAQDYFKRGKKASIFKIIFSPLNTFIQSYLLKRGFLNGLHGFILAIMHAYAAFARYVKLWELYANHKKGNK
jgi:glycosyltransferase involved in cell wall biosynthesis